MPFGHGWGEEDEDRIHLLPAVSREEENHVHLDSLRISLN